MSCLRSAILSLPPGLRGCHILIITITRLSLLRIERLGAAIMAIVCVCARGLMLRLRGRGLRCSVRIEVIVSVESLELLERLLG